MRFRLFKTIPEAKQRQHRGMVDPVRCVRLIKSGKTNGLRQLSFTFHQALVYIVRELLPEDMLRERQINEIVWSAFKYVWENREDIKGPESVRRTLHIHVVEGCKQYLPDVRADDATAVVICSEVGRIMSQTEMALPKKMRSFYRAKYIVKQPEHEIAEDLDLSQEEIDKYKADIMSFLRSAPRWGREL
jgi:hypothetical protein